MRILQINSTVNTGSTGRIAEDIGRIAILHGHESYIAYGRDGRSSQSELIRIGRSLDVYWHGAYTLFTDRHAFASRNATIQLIRKIELLQPDVIGLHNLHGYYLNVDVLFDYLGESQIPVLWTLFDCWAITGHCTYFDDIACEKWVHGCFQCPKAKKYPSSYGLSQSKRNYIDKKFLFTSVANMQLVVHSVWLKQLVERSFLGYFPIHCLPSGIDLQQFEPVEDAAIILEKYDIAGRSIILGVASVWDPRKGLADFIKLSNLIKDDYLIVLVGLSSAQLKGLPPNIMGIPRTESVRELAAWYTIAEIFVNPTWQDNFPTTNIEALACGTPVVTYNTGGSPEAVDEGTGAVVEKGDINGLVREIQYFNRIDREKLRNDCRARALERFDKNDRYVEYLNIYESIRKQRINL